MRFSGSMRGAVVIDLVDIETVVTLVFEGERLRIEAGASNASSDLIIRTASDRVMDLNALRIVGGLPWYFDEAGRKVVAHLLTGRLKIRRDVRPSGASHASDDRHVRDVDKVREKAIR